MNVATIPNRGTPGMIRLMMKAKGARLFLKMKIYTVDLAGQQVNFIRFQWWLIVAPLGSTHLIDGR